MSRLTRYERTGIIIRFLRNAEPNQRGIDQIARALDLPYSSVRLAIKEHYPHCFEHREGVGWFITGVQPEPDMPFDFNSEPVSVTPVVTTAPEKPERQSKWIWHQESLRYLDVLFGQPFSEVLITAQEKNNIDQLIILGKTLTRAAEQMKKIGRVPYED